MPCADKLLKNGNSPNGNQLMAKYKDPKPAQVKVVINGVDQNDISDVNPGGVWTSNNKYTATAVTLVLLDASGAEIQRCNYTNDGTPVTKSVKISNFSVSFDGVNPQLTWNVLEEVNVAAYIVNRYYSGALEKRLIFNKGLGLRNETDLNSIDDPANLSLYEYRIFAAFTDQVVSDELARNILS